MNVSFLATASNIVERREYPTKLIQYPTKIKRPLHFPEFKSYIFNPNPTNKIKQQNSNMREEAGQSPYMEVGEEKLQELRLKASELLLREEWQESIEAYSLFISHCKNHISKSHQNQENLSKLQKHLCLAFSNRAEARVRMWDYADALKDCDEALKVDDTHFKTLLCKGKIFLNLNRYSEALDQFRKANLDSEASLNSELLHDYMERSKKLASLSKTGAFDLSDWILGGFREKIPDLAEYIGPIEIKKSEISGRGLFATKNCDSGTVLLVTQAIAIERGILPQKDLDKNGQLVMWKNFIDKVIESAKKCSRTYDMICMLSTGEGESQREIPEMSMFKPETEEGNFLNENVDVQKILSILDVNSLVENSVSAQVLGKNSDYYGVGLWLLASFINHSCHPNARRLHIGDHVIIHSSRDIKAGEELTFAYFDILQPLNSNRIEQAKDWGFKCNCRRCKFEAEGNCNTQEIKELEMVLDKGVDMGGVVYILEEGMKRWMVRGKGKGYLRASFWAAYEETYGCEKSIRRWGRRVPGVETVVESLVEAVGSDKRIMKVLMQGMKKSGNLGGGGGGGGVVEMERTMKLGRGLYGKVMKRHALRALLLSCTQDQG